MHPLQRTAKIISYALNPLALPPLLLAALVARTGGNAREVGAALSIGALFFAALPLLFVIRVVRREPGSTLELRDRPHRTIPYTAGIGSYLLGIPVLLAAGLPAPRLLVGVMSCFVLNGILLLSINLFWKISLHVATIAGCFAIFGFVLVMTADGSASDATTFRWTIATALIGTAVVAWARVRDEAHTFGQVLGGALFGTILPLAELVALEKLSLFDTL
ncbi:MAG: hypothetical protein KDD65_13625 [Bacteroidetes bacterium]|nr:hypothetical protein [Bacteroidota bacterium]